ncbi:hypothetical protein PR048_027258 [Dryococelus australis]|uniref:Uncharacterized protein n=1 Tax=Dryococelus australis TaxID=614101 RepID=A0ABQ9GG87_9NEOP|nr:hypothetical protein PR048_027258 [Dryococelus australis]
MGTRDMIIAVLHVLSRHHDHTSDVKLTGMPYAPYRPPVKPARGSMAEKHCHSQRDHSWIFTCGNHAGRCWSADFLRDLNFPRPFIPVLLHTDLASPSSAQDFNIPGVVARDDCQLLLVSVISSALASWCWSMTISFQPCLFVNQLLKFVMICEESCLQCRLGLPPGLVFAVRKPKFCIQSGEWFEVQNTGDEQSASHLENLEVSTNRLLKLQSVIRHIIEEPSTSAKDNSRLIMLIWTGENFPFTIIAFTAGWLLLVTMLSRFGESTSSPSTSSSYILQQDICCKKDWTWSNLEDW